MPIIDADAHVIETEDTWEYVEPSEERYKPRSVPTDSAGRGSTAFWAFDRLREPRMVGDDAMTGTTAATRELLDVAARVRHMDELGVDVHVLYPTVLLQGVTADADVERSIRRSYNRWMADRCAASNGRLRWVCLPPLLSMDDAIAELEFARANGACGVLKKADVEAGRWLNDPYFSPLYQRAEELDMALCFHTGTGQPAQVEPDKFLYGRLQRLTMPVASAVHSLLLFDIPSKFPRLRFAFVEAGSAWLPFIIGNLRRRAEKIARENSLSYRPLQVGDDVLATNRIYVTCFVDEDLPYLIDQFGADNFMVGSDYGHADPARENNFVDRLRKREADGELSTETVGKILYDNPRRLYGL